MLNVKLYRFSALLAVFALAACSVFGEKNESIGGTGMLVVDTNPEPIKNKLNISTILRKVLQISIIKIF
jgi:hypothetical protein